MAQPNVEVDKNIKLNSSGNEQCHKSHVQKWFAEIARLRDESFMADGRNQPPMQRRPALDRWIRESDAAARKESRLAKSKAGFSHYDQSGRVRMVDVTQKPPTERKAEAEAFVRMQSATVSKLKRLKSPKGNPLEIARIAGITAAKRTSDLIPLCHPLSLTHVDVTAKLCQNGVEITSQAT
ncbi:MAG TPA: cyclic pyranopterin monophosphate synthase MoaC, partial [Candidatus Binatia bacterium]|nr:cyclic pyranopterin monophosphate synthase MoaC [Candidatus Binatia bacterium]